MSVSLVASGISSKIFKLFGDQVAAASTPPDNIAVTIADASISIAVISSMVIPAFVKEFSKISSLELPEEYATVFPFKSSTVLMPGPPISASPLEIWDNAKMVACPLIQSL